MMSMHEVAVVVLNHNNFPAVCDTLQDVARQIDVQPEVLLVDNGQFPAQGEAVLTCGAALLRLSRNGGYADGMNRGLDALPASAYAYVLLLTHDVRLRDPISLRRMLDYLQSHPEVGVCGPSLSTPDGMVWSAGGYLTKWTMSGRHIKLIEDSGTAKDVAWLDGACLLYRSSALAEVGLFNPRYFLYVEEVDHHFRMRRHGYSVRCLTDLTAVQSTAGAPPYYASRNQVVFLRSHHMRGRAALVTLRTMLRIIYLSLKPARRSEVSPTLRGLRHAWKRQAVDSNAA